MANYWPTATEEAIIAEKMNNLPKIVFSRTLGKIEWKNAKSVKEIIPEEISKMKQLPGKDMVILGSGSIVSALMQFGLIDEYRIIVNPFILGNGKPLFRGLKNRLNFKLLRTETLVQGTFCSATSLKKRRIGEITTTKSDRLNQKIYRRIVLSLELCSIDPAFG